MTGIKIVIRGKGGTASGGTDAPVPEPVTSDAPANGHSEQATSSKPVANGAPAQPKSSPAPAAAPTPAMTFESMDLPGLLVTILTSGGTVSAMAAAGLAAAVQEAGITSLNTNNLLDKLVSSLQDGSTPVAREGALQALAALCEQLGQPMEPYAVPLLPIILERAGDKAQPVRQAADAAGSAVMAITSSSSVHLTLPALFEGARPTQKWQTKELAFKLMAAVLKICPKALAAELPELVPLMTDGMVDARVEVQKAAKFVTEAAFRLVANRDIEPCIPAILASMAKPSEVSAAVTKLSGTTFVQAVEAPALAVMVPLLIRGLREETPIKRKCAVIIGNMSKLVNNPADATVFLSRLLPRLEQASQEVADPECRSVCSAAHETVLKIAKEAEETEAVVKYELPAALAALQSAVATASKLVVDSFILTMLEHVATLCVPLVNAKEFEFEEWAGKRVMPYLRALMTKEESMSVTDAFILRCQEDTAEKDEDVDVDDGAEILCDCKFSLAYGGKILLNNARLKLRRGHRYGLCGRNGVGKSTLMRAINDGKLEGFPPKDEVRTVYVEHDIDSSAADNLPVDFVYNDPLLQRDGQVTVTKDAVRTMLESVGFDTEKLEKGVGSLSGGWKMKLALARAMLMKPDIMLLDEPTNHLDVTNVAWLEHYLCGLKTVTCIVVSHDSSFLDTVCTDIVHYETRKLKVYRGNLSEFVKVKPEARAYYELQAVSLKFNFPKPGFLDGILTLEKPILRMAKVNFTYPGATRQTLFDITCLCNLGSRIALLGVNGAGKSTLVKILCGEARPTSGTVTKHPNLRMAYVAQHAFHHLEENLDKTPNQYIRYRYLSGEDKEETEKVTRVLTAEEEANIKNQIWMVDGQPRKLDKLLGRRKKRRSYEYEVKWVGLDSLKFNRWFPREELEQRGFTKMVNELDGKLAAAAMGADTRPLTQVSIEQYLSDFGLEPEFGTHSAIRGLSGGQKVKLVLAAAMWLNPQMMVLDEPTNYLDRESLGALATAIRDFPGGVLIISHHTEFTNALCNEVWHLEGGRLTVKKAGRPDGEEEENSDISGLSQLVGSVAESVSHVSSVADLRSLEGMDDSNS